MAADDRCLFEQRVGHTDRAPTSTGTPAVRGVQDVGLASDVAEVGADTSTDPHSTVDGPYHPDDVVVGTLGPERLRHAVLGRRVVCDRYEYAK